MREKATALGAGAEARLTCTNTSVGRLIAFYNDALNALVDGTRVVLINSLAPHACQLGLGS